MDARRSASGGFVGREAEMARLFSAFDEARRGRATLVLLEGEAGIGKTRLLEEFASAARRRRVRILVGRCHDGEGAPAYWPWVQVLRAYRRQGSARLLARHLGRYTAQFVPELGGDDVQGHVAPPTDLDQARFRFFDAVACFWKRAAVARPIVLIFDDLHAADSPSLALLRFVVREMGEARMLVVGAFRDTEVRPGQPLFTALAELVRAPVSTRITLRGLEEEDIARYIEQVAGCAPSRRVVAAVRQASDGNPFFVSELVRLLAAEGRLRSGPPDASGRWGVPPGVREVIARRLDRVSADCNAILGAAAVIGPEVDGQLLEKVVASGLARRRGRQQRVRLIAALDEALAARLLVQDADANGAYRFAHGLIREALYEDLPTMRRLQLHREVGEAIELLHGDELEAHLPELAHHFLVAAQLGDANKAVDYATRAARQATAQLAFEEASRMYRRAVQTMAAVASADDPQRWELLVSLGEAEMRAGEAKMARETFRAAAAMARRSQSPERLVRTALSLGAGFSWFWGYGAGTVDEFLVGLLREALDAQAPTAQAQRVQLLTRLAVALYWSPSTEDRASIASLSEEALALSRQLGDAGCELLALTSSHWATWGPHNASERLATASEIVRLAVASGDTQMALVGHEYALVDRLELGDARAADVHIDAYARLADQLGQPCYQWYTPMFRATRATMSGQFSLAEQLLKQVLTIGERAASETVMQAYGGHLFALRREQGRLDELTAAIEGFVERYPRVPAWQCGLALVHCELGREAEARDAFERLAARDFTELPRDNVWMAATTLLAETCVCLGDVQRAALLYDLLAPFADRNVVAGVAFFSAGPVAYYLGLLAVTLCRWDEAAVHFRGALAMSRAMHARPFVARTEYAYGRMLLVKRDTAARQTALRLLKEALATARALEMKALAGAVASAIESEAPRAVPRREATGIELEERMPEATVAGVRGRQAATVVSLGSREARPRPRMPSARQVARGTGTASSAIPRASGSQPCAGEPRSVFCNRGEYWTIAYAGDTFLLRNYKGLHYLAHLLRNPGRELHATHLVAVAGARRSGAATTCDLDEHAVERHSNSLGDAGDFLDRRAQLAYERRLKDLREDLEEAQRFNDLGRIATARREMSVLTRELTRAIGLGGRRRRAASATERARVSVTRTIGHAIQKIRANSPDLARHLHNTIRTGVFCSYNPDPRVPIAWEV